MKDMKLYEGMGIGLLVGAVIGYAVAPKRRKPNAFARRCVKTAESLIDAMSDLMGI
ncbi:MAG: hypothetical protein II881_07310 [Oscillospiraceae bacterium]|nr:hypothetical protein [Oscillospiraceae bacterium]MBR0302345.1 hypothetical protein [Clostridia bacterium]